LPDGDCMKRILVIRLSSLGDIILTLPALHVLRERYAQAHIAVAVRETYADLLAEDDRIDEVIPIPRDAGRAVPPALVAARWDLLIDLQGTPRSRRLAGRTLAGTRRCVKRDRLVRRRMLWRARTSLSRATDVVPHVVDRFLEAVGGAQHDSPAPIPNLAVSARTLERAREFVRGHGADPQRLLALVPGASHPVKAWLPENFARIGTWALEQAALTPVVIGGRSDRDVIERVAGDIGPRAITCRGEGELTFLGAVLALADAAVSADSGLGHLATAVGTPVVAVFGPTVTAFGFAPRGARDRVISLPLVCRPCSLHGNRPCRLGTHACMRGINTATVLDELAHLGVGRRGPASAREPASRRDG